MLKLIAVAKTIFPLILLYPWSMPAIAVLGVLASISEGLGISLLIPFLQNLESKNSLTTNHVFVSTLDKLLIGFEPQQRVLILAALIIGAILVKIILSYAYTVLCAWLLSHTLNKLRIAVFKQLMEVGQSFWDVNKSGELLNLIDHETFNSSRALAFTVWALINLCVIGILGSLLLLISWQLTVLVLLAFILISGIMQILSFKIEPLGKKVLLANIALSNRTLEGFTGIKTIRAFGRESEEERQYQQASRKQMKLNLKQETLSALIEPVAEGLAIVVLIGVMLISFQAQIELPVLITFIFMLYRLQPQVQRLNYNLNQLTILAHSIREVYSLLDSSDKEYVVSGNIDFTSLKQSITFKDVNFFYPSQQQPALDNLSVEIKKGKTTAFVGSSGAGKSTIINLIFRFYNVSSGAIYIDEYLSEELSLASWRRQIALVSQEVHIFSTTVRENIAYGRPDATEEEIIAAAKQAYAHEFISQLPQGYDTFVGDRGIKLSGGQKQRLSIARAVLCDPEILILDEATNSLDSISELYIQTAIQNLRKNRTVIVIAHRLSTIKEADVIVVMEKGKIAEQGSFQELLNNQGLFAKLYCPK